MWIALALSLLARAETTAEQPPWVVLHREPSTPLSSPRFPQLVVMASGLYVATFTSFEHPPVTGMNVYCSLDFGQTWTVHGRLPDVRAGALVPRKEELWMMGVENTRWPLGHVVTRRSTDLGRTWSNVEGSALGVLDAPPRVFSNAETAIVHGDRVWRTITNWYLESDDSTPIYYVRVASAKLDADWLDAANWTVSRHMRLEMDHPDAELCSLRLASTAPDELTLFFARNGPARELARSRPDDLEGEWARTGIDRGLPKEALSRRIERDDDTKSFPVLAGVCKGEPTGLHRERACHVLALWASKDLVEFRSSGFLLRDPTYDHFRVRAADWAIDDEDLLVLADIRSLETADASAPEQIVFFRVPKFRQREPFSPPLWEPKVPR